MSISKINGCGHEGQPPDLLLHVIDMGQGMAVVLQQGKTFFLYDVGYKDEHHATSLNLTMQELKRNQSQFEPGVLIVCTKPAFELLLKKRIVDRALAIISANVNPSASFTNATWKELSHLPLDHPNADFIDDKYFSGLNLHYYFNRKHPLIKYSVTADTQKSQSKEIVAWEKFDQDKCKAGESFDDIPDSSSLLYIRPSLSQVYPSILITGNTPITRVSKLENIDNENFSIFMVPHQEDTQCLSLLPLEVRKDICNTKSINDASLHLALYHMRESFAAVMEKLKGTKLEERGKSFLKYYRNNCNPEEDLEAMLQDPEYKVSQFLYKENSHLVWYKKQKHGHGTFSEMSEAVAEEESRQQQRMELFRNSLAWAHFYKHIKAELFVMSAEDLHERHTHAVLNGIIIANSWRKTKCCVLITGSLPYPLDEIFQRDVRKLVFSKEKPDFQIQVGFHSKTSSKSEFITIDPWSQTQLHTSKGHKVSVNSSQHLVNGLGEEFALNLIRDDLDVKERISTNISNVVLGHITHNRTPPLPGVSTYKYRLETYLKEIGYKITCESYGLDDVLKCLLGPPIVLQLNNFASKNIPNFEIVPELLKLKAKGSSTFYLTPTKCSAYEAEIDVFISRSRPLMVGPKKITSASVTVKKAKTESLVVIFSVNINSKLISFHIAKHLDLSGSCGSTVADHVYGICCKEEAWLRAKELTVGEVLHIFLQKEKALHIIQSLPLFFSYPLAKCKINHYLSTVLVDSSSQELQEGHIYVTNAINLPPVFINQKKLSLRIKCLAIHISPSTNANRRIRVEGKCILNDIIPLNLSCSSTEDSDKSMKFLFDESNESILPSSEVFNMFGIENLPSTISQPPCGTCLDSEAKYEVGFTLSQRTKSSLEIELASLFFEVELGNQFQTLLPPSLSHVQNIETKMVLHHPKTSPKLGVEATFTSKLEDGKSDSVLLDCCFSVIPYLHKSSYKYELCIEQNSCDSSQELTGMSIYSVVSALTGSKGTCLTEEINSIPSLGEQVMHRTSLTKIRLEVLDREIQVLEVDASISNLEIMPNKLSVSDCSLKLFYTKEGLNLEGNGRLRFLRHYDYQVSFSLPTTRNKGKFEFKSFQHNLTLLFLMDEFGLLSSAKKNPVLAEVLDSVIKQVGFELSVLQDQGPGRLQILTSDITIFKEKLDINLVTFHDIELAISSKFVDDSYVHNFFLKAYISEAFYAHLQYNADDHVMSGKVSVTFSKFVSATDTLRTFQPCSSSYDNMAAILEKEFMDVFHSDLRILPQPGMTASLYVSISLPIGNSKFALQHLKLDIEDALRICCKNSYILHKFQFEYHNRIDTTVSHLVLAVHKLNSDESMTLDFDFTTKEDNTSLFTASVKAGPQGGFLKLRSAIDLAKAAIPDLPKFEVGLPPVFDIELVSGSITFATKPRFKPTAFDISIMITEWQVFQDPKLKVHQLTLRTDWETGTYPQLSFTDCSLTFLEHNLDLKGKLTAEEVYIQCCSAKKVSESKSASFHSILQDCTPASQGQPVVPADIGLPSMEVKLKEFIIQLKENYKKFRVNAGVVAKDWMIKFGSHYDAPVIPVHELGGALEWEVEKSSTNYKAFLYGTVELFGMLVYMEMMLGKNIDAIVAAKFTDIESLHYSQIADNLVSSEDIVPSGQYNPQTSGLAQLAPSSVQDIKLTSGSVFLNVSKKQFFLTSQVSGWGIGSLLIGYLNDMSEMDYVISLTIQERLKFSRLSTSLAFVDELLTLRKLNVLMSSTDLHSLSDLTNQYCKCFSASGANKNQNKPFYESVISSKLTSDIQIREGTTIYAEVDFANSKGINSLIQLGDKTIGDSDIAILTYIGKSKASTNLEVHAWIKKILLFEMLEFSDIHVKYLVQKTSEFELSGSVALDLKLDGNPALKFDGKLTVDPAKATFTTKSCRDIVSQPCGIHVSVSELQLSLVMQLDGTCPDVLVSGCLDISGLSFTCKFCLKGVTFKVFIITLNRPLQLSALFRHSSIDWPIQLNIIIKEGYFYYGASEASFEEDGKLVTYEEGFHLEAVITLLEKDFRVKVDVPSDRSDVVLSGRSVKTIDFGFAKITGARPYTHEGPELKYRGKEKSLCLTVGVEILKHPCFEGELKYMFSDKSLEGMIRYPGRFLWINEPAIKVRWSPDDGFSILDFSLDGDIPGFSMLTAILKFAKIIYDIVKSIFSWSVNLHVKTGRNPDPKRHLVKLILYGEFVITVIGFTIPVIPLPEIPILLPRMDDFSFSKLPQYILKCLWDSAGPICRSLINYINPWNLIKQTAKMIWNGVKQVGKTIVNVGKAVVGGIKKVGRKIASWFGFSAFIMDIENGTVLGYIRGGRGGRDLFNERYIIKHFGPILTVSAINNMAHDIHKHYKMSLDACKNDKERDEEDDDESYDEVDGEKIDLDKGLEDLKGKAEELSESWTIVADKILIIKDISVKLHEETNDISVQWCAFNPEEEIFFNEDKGDIEYHVKVNAITVDQNKPNNMKLYDEIFLNTGKDEESEGEESHDFSDSQQQQMKEPPQKSILSEKDSENSIDDNALATDQLDHIRDQTMSEPEDLINSTSTEEEAAQIVEEDKPDNQKLEDEVKTDNEEAVIDMKESLSSEQSKNTFSKQRKLINLKIPVNSRTARQIICLNVSIQPKVTLEVRMLSPDKIATEDYTIDPERIKANDISWMPDAKKEMISHGRVKEVTLEGSRASVQQLIHLESPPNLSFTAECKHEENALTITGEVMPLPEANYYLIQLLDETDHTVIIEQLLLQSKNLHYIIEAKTSDIPPTSSGPYCLSALALSSDLRPCSSIMTSVLRIDRYCPPEQLKITIPNLDSSNLHIVKLEWKHPKENIVVGKTVEGDSLDSSSQEIETSQQEESPLTIEQESEESPPVECGTHPTSPSESSVVEQSNNHFYLFTVSCIHIKRIEDFKKDEINETNVNIRDKTFQVSEKVCIDPDPDSIVTYDFKLRDIVRKKKHEIQGGLLFQCQIVTGGVDKLLSMPKFFSEFILLASPANFRATAAADKIAGFNIQWDYCPHAIEYRIELVDESKSGVAFSRVVKCVEGHRGEVTWCSNDFKDIIPATKTNIGYKLHIYSLGFGQDLIRCLEPSVAEGKFYFMSSSIRYLESSDIIQVKFVPLVRAQYMVKLYQMNQKGDNLTLQVCSIYCKKANKETLIEFQVKSLWHLIKSGNSVFAWIYCVKPTSGHSVTYIGSPKENTHVLSFPLLDGSICCKSNFFMKSLKLTWSAVQNAQKYQYGYYFPATNECVSVKETQETKAVVYFGASSLNFLHSGYHQFQVYVVAKEEFGTGELSLHSTLLQCIKSPMLVGREQLIVYSSITLQQHVWNKHISVYKPLALYNPKYMLFPSGVPFPNVNIPSAFWDKFWETDGSLFGMGHLYACDVLDFKKKVGESNTWKRKNPFEVLHVEPKRKKGVAELVFLFYTKCSSKASSGKKKLQKIEIEIKIELEGRDKNTSHDFKDKNLPLTTVSERAPPNSKVNEESVSESGVSSRPDGDVSEDTLDKEGDVENSESKNQSEDEAKGFEESSSNTSAHIIDPESDVTDNNVPTSGETGILKDELTLPQDEAPIITEGKSSGAFQFVKKKVKSVVDLGKSAASSLTEAAKELASTVVDYIPFTQTYTEVYKRKITISLPHGQQSPKLYRRIIRYRRVDCKLIYEPFVSITITPTPRSEYEDTHLFVRFAGFKLAK